MLSFNAFWIIVSSTKPLTERRLTVLGFDDLGLDRSPYQSFWFQACVGILVSQNLPSCDMRTDVIIGLTRYFTALQRVHGMNTVKLWYVSSLVKDMWAWVFLIQVPFLCTFFGGKFPCYFRCAAETRQQVGKTSSFTGPLVSSVIITASGGNGNMPFAFLFGLWVSWQHSNSYWLNISSQWSIEHYLSLDDRCWQESKGMWRVHLGRELP